MCQLDYHHEICLVLYVSLLTALGMWTVSCNVRVVDDE